jgi:hypothetical protein
MSIPASNESPLAFVWRRLAVNAARLTFLHRRFAPEWLKLAHLYPEVFGFDPLAPSASRPRASHRLEALVGRDGSRPAAAPRRDRRVVRRSVRARSGRLRLDRAGRPERPQGLLPRGPATAISRASNRPIRRRLPRPERRQLVRRNRGPAYQRPILRPPRHPRTNQSHSRQIQGPRRPPDPETRRLSHLAPLPRNL